MRERWTRSSVVRGALLWLAASAVGAVIVALPDQGRRLISLSDTHGPSWLDAVGIVFLVAGWGVFVSVLWRARERIRHRLVLAAVAVVGAAVLAWSISQDAGAWWVVGVALLAFVQLVAVVSAARGAEEVLPPGQPVGGE